MAQPQPLRPEEERVTPIRAVTMEEEREAIAEANIISVANPISLGLTTFGLSTFLGGVVAVGFYQPESFGFLVPIGFLFGGVAQFLAGMWAFRKNDSLTATLFTSYGAFWLALSILIAGVGTGAITLGPALMPMVGMLFAAWGIEMVYLWVASMRHSVSLAAVTGLLLLSLALLSIGSFAGSNAFIVAGGWAAIISSICAWYTAAAHVINDTFKEHVLPIWPSGK